MTLRVLKLSLFLRYRFVLNNPIFYPIISSSGYLFKKITGQELPQQGEDIHDVIRLSPELAKTGGPYAYFHRLLQKKLVVKIPADVKEGQKIRLADMGREGKGGAEPGDLYLTVKIKQPLLEQVKRWVKGRAKPPAV